MSPVRSSRDGRWGRRSPHRVPTLRSGAQAALPSQGNLIIELLKRTHHIVKRVYFLQRNSFHFDQGAAFA